MSTGFDPVNMFWKMLLNAQEMNQLALKVFLNSQKIQQSQQSMEQLLQECMACVGDNTSMGLSMLQSLSKVKNPEEFVKIQERITTEYGEKNLDHAKKFMGIYHNLWQEVYNYAKENASDFGEKFTEAASTITNKITENVTKFAENAANFAGSSSCCGTKGTGGGGNAGNKKHQNIVENTN